MYANRNMVEHSFEEGYLAFLRFQPYKQYSLKKSGVEKLKPHIYGLYTVVQRVGKVAYELELLEGSKIHTIFYVLCLKKELGQ
jgi:hypothetical protein